MNEEEKIKFACTCCELSINRYIELVKQGKENELHAQDMKKIAYSFGILCGVPYSLVDFAISEGINE